MRKLRTGGSLAGAALLISIWAGPASAELVSQDFLATGDGLITLDTTSGAQWLDFSLTRGLSLEEVLALDFVSAGGFRLATEEQVLGMWREAGVTLVGNFPNYSSVPQINRLHALFGTTGARAGYGDSDGHGPFYIATDGSVGRLYQESIGTPSSLSFFALLAVSDDGVAAYANVIGGSLLSRDPTQAWYMVKPVPLPASFWLLASAASLLGLRRGSTRAQLGIGRSGSPGRHRPPVDRRRELGRQNSFVNRTPNSLASLLNMGNRLSKSSPGARTQVSAPSSEASVQATVAVALRKSLKRSCSSAAWP